VRKKDSSDSTKDGISFGSSGKGPGQTLRKSFPETITTKGGNHETDTPKKPGLLLLAKEIFRSATKPRPVTVQRP